MTKVLVVKIAACCITLAVLISVFSAPANSQVTGATLSGTVADPSGALISGAQVSIKNTGTTITRDVTTDSGGFYSAPNLQPGNYEITVSASGFAKIVNSNIDLAVGAQKTMNFSMRVGQSTQTVEVTGNLPAVELSTATISAVVDSTTVRELPLNGRDWTQLATLQPGVSTVRTQASTNSATTNRANRGFGNQLTVSGHSPYENNYRVNGISINDYTNGSPGSVIGVNLGTDAIQEFSVLTTDYPSEYGRTSGGVINSITKSGTNGFHGNVFGFLRNASLDAKNYFDDPAKPIPPFYRYQFGGSAGGPIIKDKTFFFGAYEGVLQHRSATFFDTVPSAASRAAAVPAIRPYLAFWPVAPAGAPSSDGGVTQNLTVNALLNLKEHYATARVDHHFSDKDTLSGSWLFDRGPQTQPDPLANVLTELFSFRQMYGIEETHVFSPTLVNTMRFGFNRVHGINGGPVSAITAVAGDTTLGVRPGIPAPIITVSGLTATNSLGSASQNLLVSNSFQYYEDAFWTHSAHSLKFGFSLERIQFNDSTRQRPNGNFTFGSVAAFLSNSPTKVQELSPVGAFEEGSRQTLFGFYVQDDWHVRSNLTFNLGLRYEPTTLPHEVLDRFQVLKNPTDRAVVPVPTLWSGNQSLKNFEPRVGFSWDPFRKGTTAIRGGFGVFDVVPIPWTYTQTLAGQFPFAAQFSAGGLKPGDFPIVKSKSLGVGTLGVVYIPQNPPRTYAMNWNLNVQHQISSSLSATIGYVGSRSVHLPDLPDDVNFSLPTLTSAGYMWPKTGGTVLNPNFGGIRARLWDNDGWYDGLQAGVTKRLSHGFQFQGSYTFGRCFDTGSNMAFNDPYQNSLPDYMYFDHRLTKGFCDYNVTHSGVVSYIWSVPTGKNMSGIAEKIVGGWQIGGIITAQSGSPFTPVVAGDPLGRNAGDTEVDYVNILPGCDPINGSVKAYLNLSCFTPPTAPASFASQCNNFTGAATPPPSGQVYCSNLFGNVGRNRIEGPGVFDFDFSVFKNIKISERFSTQFRAEFFNISITRAF